MLFRSERSSVPDYERKVISARIVGVGDPLSEESSRRALGLRIVNLGLGYSAVSPNVVEQLVAMYNANITPVVSSLGSIGSSDLGQCAQLCATAIGVGEVWVRGERMSASEGLASIGRQPVDLGAKDALGLFNSGAVTQTRAIEYVEALRNEIGRAHV